MTETNEVAHLVNKPLPEEITPPVPAVVEPQAVVPSVDNEALDDIALSRKTLRDMIEKGADAVKDIGIIANSSEHPRVFEVMGQLIKTVAETATSLVQLQKTKKEILADDPQQNGDTNIENAVFVGSTDELQKLIKKNKPVIDVEVIEEHEPDDHNSADS